MLGQNMRGDVGLHKVTKPSCHFTRHYFQGVAYVGVQGTKSGRAYYRVGLDYYLPEQQGHMVGAPWLTNTMIIKSSMKKKDGIKCKCLGLPV